MLSVSKKFEFSASHTLNNPNWSAEKNIEVFGKCANPSGHGHNYRLEVSVSGEVDPDTGMLIDARELKKLVMDLVVEDLDHKNLNCDVPWLEGKIPSIENIVDQIWNQLEEPIRSFAPRCYLSRLKLWETSTIYVVRELDR